MFYQSGIQIDELGGTIIGTTPIVVNVEIDCFDGHELSCDSVSNFVVEAKHSSEGAYSDIENTPKDLSSWDGTAQTFNLRFTATSTTGVFSFRISTGPITPVVSYTYVYNDDGDEVYNDDSDLVRTLA